MYKEMIAELVPVYGRGEAAALVRMVMEERFGLTLTDMLLGRDEGLTEVEVDELRGIVSRLAAGEPVQQVLGYADFCGHRFHVTGDVLIPRRETEELVEWVREFDNLTIYNLLGGGKRTRILDLGTGSGCIAIALALDGGDVCVTAVDVSASALAVARENAARLGADNVRFVQADMLTIHNSTSLSEKRKVKSEKYKLLDNGKTRKQTENAEKNIENNENNEKRKQTENAEKNGNDENNEYTEGNDGEWGVGFDVIVSNPPYVMRSEAAAMHENVLGHEPALALFVPDEDPLVFYRAIVGIAQRCLLPGGCVFVELNSALAEDVASLFREAGFADVELRRDVFGRWRMLRAGGLRAR